MTTLRMGSLLPLIGDEFVSRQLLGGLESVGRQFISGGLDAISTAALIAFTLFVLYIVYAYSIGEIPVERYLSNDWLPGVSAIIECIEQEEYTSSIPIECIIAPWSSSNHRNSI